jgi:BirA family transcriptional regulator, biotin operon repressor / biotin---[acetyl-CoA-carboxylase] ligase
LTNFSILHESFNKSTDKQLYIMIIGSKYIFHEILPSTNSYASTLLRNQSLQEGTIIFTSYQTAGRGQTTNSWESEENKNLLFSVILYPHMIRPEEQFFISKIVSLGICDFLYQHANNISIKWPNDIYIKNDKIAGILIESSIMRDKIENTIVGIGLNLNQKNFRNDGPNPVSLALNTGKEYNIQESLTSLAFFLDKRYEQLMYGKWSEIDNEYLGNLYRYKQWRMFSDSRGIFEGRIVSVNSLGHLKIEDQSGRIFEYSHKEVNFL